MRCRQPCAIDPLRAVQPFRRDKNPLALQQRPVSQGRGCLCCPRARPRSRFSEEQIIGILREQEAYAATADVCRKHGISSATFYKWKAKYGGLEVSDARRLNALEDENAKLKKLLAEAMLDNAMLKDVASKKW